MSTRRGLVGGARRAPDVRPWQRAATCWVQAMLLLRWFKDDPSSLSRSILVIVWQLLSNAGLR